MADVIARFKGDTSDLDTKIKKASQTLMQMESDCRKVGGAFIHLEKKDLDFIKSLGKLETGAKSAQGTMSDLTKAFTDMSAVYNRLSEEEKKDEGGKALRASLDQLKERIKEGKKELEGISNEIGNNGNMLAQLSSKFGVNIKQLGTWGAALAAGKAALDVLKDAFFSNEQQLDEWGRITESSKSVYEGFLDALNTGDISGYLQRIDQIVSAARNAYNTLDELATYNAFNQINVEKARTGLTESMADYRSGKGSKGDVQKAATEMKKQLSDRAKMERDAYENEIKKIATRRGVNSSDLMKALSGSYGNYTDLKGTKLTGVRYRTVGGGMFGAAQTVQESYAANERERLGDALRRLNDTELKSLQALGAQAQRTATEVAQVDKQVARTLGSGTGKNGTTVKKGGSTQLTAIAEPLEGSISYYQKLASDASKAINEAATTEARKAAQALYDEYTQKIREIKMTTKGGLMEGVKGADVTQGLTTITGPTKDMEDRMKRWQEYYDKLKQGGKDASASWQEATSSIAGVGHALQSIDNPAAKVFGIIAEAIANVAGAFASSLAGDQSSKTNIYAFIAAAASGVTTMISTISAIKSATEYHAQGGIVGQRGPFIPRGTDTIPAMLTPGEVVLSRSQTNRLASQLQSTSASNAGGGQPWVDSEKVYLGIGNHLKRTGQGEIITSRNINQYIR